MARTHLAGTSLGLAVVALLAAGDADSLEAAALLAPKKLTERYLERLAACRTEQEALVADLVARGINPSPSAAWTDPAL